MNRTCENCKHNDNGRCEKENNFIIAPEVEICNSWEPRAKE